MMRWLIGILQSALLIRSPILAVAAASFCVLTACDSGGTVDAVFGGVPSPTPVSGVIGNSALSLSPSVYSFGLISVGQAATPLTMVI